MRRSAEIEMRCSVLGIALIAALCPLTSQPGVGTQQLERVRRTLSTLGLTMPQSILVRADEVIQ